jgi:hypothetical protein
LLLAAPMALISIAAGQSPRSCDAVATRTATTLRPWTLQRNGLFLRARPS